MKWLRLLIAYDGHAAGEMLQVDGTNLTEATARALITGKIAEDGGNGPERALSESVNTELANLRTGLNTAVTGIVEDLRGATARLNAPRIEGVESEDEKIFRGAQFKGLGHLAQTVRVAFHPTTPNADARAQVGRYSDAADKVTRAVTGMSEGVDPDGGILVPPDSTNEIWDRIRDEEGSPVKKARTFTVSGNRLPLPAVDETSRVDGSRFGGIQAYWEGEADQLNGTKPKFRSMDLRLKKLAALVYVTDELLEDARGLDSFLSQAVPQELGFKLGNAMFRGSGAGMPLGILNAGCFLAVTKKVAQATLTVVTENILSIWARSYAKSRRNAEWYINQDIEPQLGQLALAVGSAGGQLTYTPPGGVSGNPYATLMGRPVQVSEFASSLTNVGDIGLYDWSQYALITKGGVKTAASMHLRFDYGETAFRWTMRADGQPFWNTTLTPFQGSNTLSPFVAVEAR